MNPRILVVGAGLAGLSAAQRLQSAGCQVRVVDKGRRPGGRLASRPIGGTMFNHGAQFFTARSEEFTAAVHEWLDRGVAREWARGFQRPDGHPRYAGVPSMNAIAAHLASGLDVHCGIELESLWPEADAVDAVVLTPPVPQAVALLGRPVPELESIVYDRCLALMVIGARCTLPEKGALHIPDGEPISWIADENSRAGLPVTDPRPLLIHSGPQFALDYWDRPREEAATALLAAARVEAWDAWEFHRWRFAKPTVLYPEPFFRTTVDRPCGGSALRLYFAGDAFGEPRVEGAVRSGWAVAADLLP